MRRGSSPLARGLPHAGAAADAEWGIIPARAGFTPVSPRWSPPSSDHPRSRGVYNPLPGSEFMSAGSSPLARGLRDVSTAFRSGPGIIPARAGFTRAVTAQTPAGADHPRSRGVYVRVSLAPGSVRGSSPLARGLRGISRLLRARLGIIPARAGFTRSCRAKSKRWGDHPRSRGVY